MATLKTTEQLMELTKDQIREYADVYAGMHLPATLKKSEMAGILSKVSSSATEAADIVPKEETQAALKKSGRVGTGPGPGRIRIMVARTAQDERQRPVFLGHRGDACLVKRGVEVDLQAKYVVCSLNDAIEFKHVWDDDIDTGAERGGYVLKEQHSYPFSIIQFGPDTDEAKEALGYEV